MKRLTTKLRRIIRLPKCCQPPAAPTGLTAVTGGGSGEVQLTWDPLPADESVVQYRVYRRKSRGIYYLLAVVTPKALGLLEPDRLGIVDAPDYWPWPTGADPTAERCYAVSALSAKGLEGPMSPLACAIGL